MRRRPLIAGGLALVATARIVLPQAKDKIWRVGVPVLTSRAIALDPQFFIGGFPQGMRERGYAEGKNLLIDWRFANGDLARLPGLAMDLVQSKPEVIVAAGQAAIRAVRNATSTIRVVMGGPGDPVAEGYIESLARPGANITGAATSAGDISSKRLELLLQAVPKVRRVALRLNPASRTHQVTLASMHIAAQMTKLVVVPVEARTSQEIEAAFVTIKREKVDAIAIQPDAIFNLHVHQIAELAMQQRLPSVAGIREYVDAGLLSGGPVRLHLEAVREIRLRAHSGNPRSRSHPLQTDIRSPM